MNNDGLETLLADRLSRERQRIAPEHLLALFHVAQREVPAYRAFLAAHQVDAGSVTTYEDFIRLPLMTKDNYINTYPLPMRCRGGTLANCEILSMSSGSTGNAVAWPRSLAHELDVSTRFEQAFAHSFGARDRSTLVVVCFAMGTWVGGLYTVQCCRHLAQKGYRITLVTPGNNLPEILRVVGELAPHFDQLVLAGYPPFLKEVLDRGALQGVSWSRYAVKLILAGEVFSEEWRNRVCERLGAVDPRYATVSLYGTADAGVLGNETPLSINIRRFFAANPRAAREVFGESRLPTLVQYDPCSRFFETYQDTLVVSGNNGVPLLRYHIADKGGVLAFDPLLETVRQLGGSPMEGIVEKDVVPLPFVYLFGRADFTVSYFGANVFPENVSVGLEQISARERVSGKFVLQVIEDEQRDSRLQIVVELSSGVLPADSIAATLSEEIRKQLVRLNSEFAHYVPVERQAPEIVLRLQGDPEYFPVGVKHRYTRK